MKKPFDPFDEDTYPGNEPEKAEVPPMWPDVLDIILQKLLPATEQDYTERLTTQEIQTLLINHCGEAPLKPELVEDLTSRGYVYAMLGSGLEWLLKKKD